MKIKDVANKLIWATAIISMIRYMGSFVASDVGMITGWPSDGLTLLLAISGMAMGFLDSIGTALLFNGWRKVMPSAGVKWSFKFRMLTIFVTGLFISSLSILVPFTLSRIEKVSISVILGGPGTFWEWTWGTMVNVIPFLIVGGVTIGNKWIEDLESGESPKKVTKEDEKVTSNLPADWRKIRPGLTSDQVKFIAYSEPRMIVQEFAKSGITVSPRTASNWRASARDELKKNNNPLSF